MTTYRFYYYDTKERTRDILAKSYWQAVYEFNKGGIKAWRVIKIKQEATNED
jgi:hypothetical protein